MTTLVGIEGPNWSVMAADSQISDESFKIISTATPKLIEYKDLVIGLRGDARPGDLIAYDWKPPRISGDIKKWVVSKMIPSMIDCFNRSEYDWQHEDADYNFLVSVKGKIFDIGSDLSISKSDCNIYASGSGRNLAIGYSIGQRIDTIENAILTAHKAIETSAKFDIHTSLPVQIIVQDYS